MQINPVNNICAVQTVHSNSAKCNSSDLLCNLPVQQVMKMTEIPFAGFFSDLIGKKFSTQKENDMFNDINASLSGKDKTNFEILYKPGRLSNPLVEEKILYGRTAADHTITQGAVKLLVIEGNRYILEYVVKTASFEDYFMPALIILALVLLILAVGISLLTALIPYNQYKKAYENNAYKNNLIDSLAHNMKTPLQILGGYAENLKDVEDVSEKNVYADRILEKTFEMNKDIEAILKTAERNDRKYVSASVRKCVGEVAEKLNAKVTITGDMTLKMDEEYFKTALFCLIDNAEKYKIADSEVVVDITSNGFTVTNMAEASKFTPGTGLAIAGRIFEQHKLYLNTSLKDGVFVVRAGKKPIA